jgi:hypothetical protein
MKLRLFLLLPLFLLCVVTASANEDYYTTKEDLKLLDNRLHSALKKLDDKNLLLKAKSFIKERDLNLTNNSISIKNACINTLKKVENFEKLIVVREEISSLKRELSKIDQEESREIAEGAMTAKREENQSRSSRPLHEILFDSNNNTPTTRARPNLQDQSPNVQKAYNNAFNTIDEMIKIASSPEYMEEWNRIKGQAYYHYINKGLTPKEAERAAEEYAGGELAKKHW